MHLINAGQKSKARPAQGQNQLEGRGPKEQMKKVNVIHVFLYPYMKIEQRNHEYQRQVL
jgi:hypothetical protein